MLLKENSILYSYMKIKCRYGKQYVCNKHHNTGVIKLSQYKMVQEISDRWKNNGDINMQGFFFFFSSKSSNSLS